MTFQFPQTSAFVEDVAEGIAAQIAQLQEQLNKLTAANTLLKECEQQAAELLEQVTNHVQLMRDKGIESQSLIDWANQMYLVITGVSMEALHQEIFDLKSDKEVLKLECEELEKRLVRTVVSTEALHQEITGLKCSKEALRFECKQLQKRLDIYKQDTQEIDSYAQELQQLREENANYQARYEKEKAQKEQWESDYYKIRAQRDELQQKLQQISYESNEKDELTSCEQESNIPEQNLILGDIVQHVEGQVGTVTYIPEPFNGIVSVKMVNGNFNYHTSNLKLVSRPSQDSTASNSSSELGEQEVVTPELFNPSPSSSPQPLTEAQAQTIGSEFIKNITSKADVDKITWSTIKQVSQGDIRVLKEMALTARTKAQKQLIENIPELLAVHIKLTGDSEDLNWVNSIIRKKAEELLEQKRSLQIDSILQAAPEDSELNLQAVEV